MDFRFTGIGILISEKFSQKLILWIFGMCSIDLLNIIKKKNNIEIRTPSRTIPSPFILISGRFSYKSSIKLCINYIYGTNKQNMCTWEVVINSMMHIIKLPLEYLSLRHKGIYQS